jgi:hypothetical protein
MCAPCGGEGDFLSAKYAKKREGSLKQYLIAMEQIADFP